MASTVLRFGDPDGNPEQSIILNVRTSKATAIARPPSMKKFARADGPQNEDMMDWDGQRAIQYAPVKTRADLFIKEEREEAAATTKENGNAEGKSLKDENPVKVELDEDGEPIGVSYHELAATTKGDSSAVPVTDENTQIAYKYGSTYIPVDKTDFDPLKTEKGMDIVGFIPQKTVSPKHWLRSVLKRLVSFAESGQWARFITSGVIQSPDVCSSPFHRLSKPCF